MQSSSTVIDNNPAATIGSGTYGTAYLIQDGNGRVAKILKGHTKVLRSKYKSLYVLLTRYLAVVDDVPYNTAHEASETIRATSMLMMSSHPAIMHETEDGTVIASSEGAVGRWAPLVLRRTDGYYYAMHRDADLAMREMHSLLPLFKACPPGLVSADLEVIVKNETDVYMAVIMPQLCQTHFEVRQMSASIDAPGGLDAILQRWADRLVPLVAHLLASGVVHTDISPKNVMVDKNYDSYLIDLDSCLRLESARRLEPAVGLVSLVPKSKWGDECLYRAEVLRYAMIFAAMVSTLSDNGSLYELYPAESAAGVLHAHDSVFAGLTTQTRALVSSLLGDTRWFALQFAEIVFGDVKKK